MMEWKKIEAGVYSCDYRGVTYTTRRDGRRWDLFVANPPGCSTYREFDTRAGACWYAAKLATADRDARPSTLEDYVIRAMAAGPGPWGSHAARNATQFGFHRGVAGFAFPRPVKCVAEAYLSMLDAGAAFTGRLSALWADAQINPEQCLSVLWDALDDARRDDVATNVRTLLTCVQ